GNDERDGHGGGWMGGGFCRWTFCCVEVGSIVFQTALCSIFGEKSYFPAPRRRGADYSASPRRRHEEHPRSPPRGHPRGEEDGKYSRRSYSPGYEGGSAAEPEKNGEDEIRE
ncbi:unnamed protein product, partial [Brassica oleracea]